MEEPKNLGGRPPIGPAVTASVPPDVALWIKKQARLRRMKQAAIVRQLILAGHYQFTKSERQGRERAAA